MRKGAEGNVTKRFGVEGGKHHGPIFAIQRNPAQSLSKYFLTIGDWSAKLWADDSDVPLITTRYHDAYLTDGCWSTTRSGIFFITRSDGWIDIWDYYYRQNEICFSQKISDYPLTCIAMKPKTSDILIGDASGSVTLLQLCKSLWEPMPKGVEDGSLKVMFEREGSREKTLQQQKKRIATLKAKEAKKEAKKEIKKKDLIEEKITELEADFFKTLKEYQDKIDSGIMDGSGVFREEEKKKEEKKIDEPKEEKKDEERTGEVKAQDTTIQPTPEDQKQQTSENQKQQTSEDTKQQSTPEDTKQQPTPEDTKQQPTPEDQKQQPTSEDKQQQKTPEDSKVEPTPEDKKQEGKTEDKKPEETSKVEESRQDDKPEEVKPETSKVEESQERPTEEKKEPEATKTEDKKDEEHHDAELGDEAHLALVDDLDEHENSNDNQNNNENGPEN